MKNTNFLGQECVLLENEVLELLVTQNVGPRILSLRFADGENLLAELPDFVTDCPGTGTFHFYGGHRLWHAPEEPSRTYLPDDSPVDISALDKGLKITQFKTGGTAIFPQIRTNTGVLPNRTLTLWPYTDMTHPNVHWGSNFILVKVDMTSAFKIGFPNPRGWQAYWLKGTLFVKHAEYNAQAEYYDWGCSSESYCNDKFIELETLAPITTLAPNATATHVETWDLYKDIECPQNEKEVQVLADKLGLK